MALILSLRQGHDFYVEDERVVVSHIFTTTQFNLMTDDGEVHLVTEDTWAHILPNARAQAGIPREQDGAIVRVAIEAPGQRVTRGELYRAANGQHKLSRNDARLHGGKPMAPPAKACEACKGSGVLSTTYGCTVCGGHGCSTCTKGVVRAEFSCPECTGGAYASR